MKGLWLTPDGQPVHDGNLAGSRRFLALEKLAGGFAPAPPRVAVGLQLLQPADVLQRAQGIVVAQ